MRHLFLTSLAVVAIVTGIVGRSEAQSPSASTTCSAAGSFDLAAMRKVIEENNLRFTRAHVTGDQALIDAMFTQDARSLPPESEPVIGRAAISKLTADYIAFGVAEFSEETTDFYGNEELLIDQGNYVMVYGKDKTTEKGKYLNVWKQEGGTWKIYSNVWNTNAPPTPAK
jgi:ketosteroid isomerase-like protein